jgi:hypothetical protein
MRRRYLVAFVVVLLLACAGGFFGGRFLIHRLQQDFGAQTTWAPPTVTLPDGEGQVTPTSALTTVRLGPSPSSAARPAPATAAPARIVVTVPAPVGVESPIVETTPSEPTPTETKAVFPSPSPKTAFAITLAKPVRHSTGDCPGSYILGQVTDRGGTPLSDVRILLADEYGNQEIKVTKAGADAGRYDFPLFGAPRRFYLSVVDAGGHPISPGIEISHGVGADAQATCHWADWQRQ